MTQEQLMNKLSASYKFTGTLLFIILMKTLMLLSNCIVNPDSPEVTCLARRTNKRYSRYIYMRTGHACINRNREKQAKRRILTGNERKN